MRVAPPRAASAMGTRAPVAYPTLFCPSSTSRVEAVRAHRLDELAATIDPHSCEIGGHNGSLYAATALPPRMRAWSVSGRGDTASLTSLTTPGWNSGCG